MGYQSRTETYWIREDLFAIENHRPTGFGRWSLIRSMQKQDLVATIVGERGEILIREGPMATPERVAKSLLIHYGVVEPQNIDRTIWREIPEELIEGIRQRISQSDSRLAERWSQFSNEEAMTGALFTGAAGQIIFDEGWVARLEFVEFSKHLKEGETGADVAIVIDVLYKDGRRAVKTVWFQAKRGENLPVDWRVMPELQSQLNKMRHHTKSSYGIIYTRRGAFVVGSEGAEQVGIPLDKIVVDTLHCEKGDERISVFAQSLDRLNTYRIWIRQEF